MPAGGHNRPQAAKTCRELGVPTDLGGGRGYVIRVVQPGDSLWSIARSAAGTSDVRVVVAQIRRLNALHDTRLRPGQTLRLP